MPPTGDGVMTVPPPWSCRADPLVPVQGHVIRGGNRSGSRCRRGASIRPGSANGTPDDLNDDLCQLFPEESMGMTDDDGEAKPACASGEDSCAVNLKRPCSASALVLRRTARRGVRLQLRQQLERRAQLARAVARGQLLSCRLEERRRKPPPRQLFPSPGNRRRSSLISRNVSPSRQCCRSATTRPPRRLSAPVGLRRGYRADDRVEQLVRHRLSCRRF
jgi:hypothetical protein